MIQPTTSRFFSRLISQSPSKPLRPSSLSRFTHPRPSRSGIQLPHTHRTITTINTQPSPPSKWPRRLRNLFYIALFGYIGSSSVSFLLRPLLGETNEPDSPKDLEIRRLIQLQFDNLDIVEELRANPEYIEWEPYSNFTPEEKERRLTSGSLKGSRGVPLQRVFWNEKEKSAINVIFLGNGVEGWPTVVHGGTLAIILDENMGRVALRVFPARTGVTANLDINYKAPVSPGSFIIVRARYDAEKSAGRKAIVHATIEDLSGRVCTTASALFIEPRNLKLKSLGDGF